MIVGLAGHIDHGKTSLVKAITGVDADRLKEEKARGITIDLGFAYWPQGDGATIGFVDVPGHERFVHTMLAGAQGVDLAMLVVAADDGPMPQTREHLEILGLLGLQRAIVALTKIDKVDAARVKDVAREITALLAPTPFAGAPVSPVSSATREGLPELEARLRACARDTSDRARGLFRLAVDRSFVLQGAGVVVTGMALDGVVRVGDELVVSPSGLTARVRSIHAQNRKAEIGRAGERCALNLVGPEIAKEAINRGDMLVDPRSHAPTRRIDVELTAASGAAKGITQWMPARLHHGAAEVGARIVLLGDAPIAAGETGLAQLVLDAPIAARARDHFVLRDVSASRTLGGGRFIDVRAPERRRRTPARLATLAALAHDDGRQALAALLALPSGFVDLDDFARDRGADAEAATRWLAEVGGVELSALRKRYAFGADRLSRIRSAVTQALATHHAENPDRSGPGVEALRLKAAPAIPAPLFRELLRLMVAEGAIAVAGNFARLSSHRAELSVEDENLWLEIAPLLKANPRFRPPRVRDVGKSIGEDEEKVRRLMKRLARRGDVDEVAHDHFFPRVTVSEMARLARQANATSGSTFVAGVFRDALEADGQVVGRKVAIQILEFFDRHGYTIRRGDDRRINPHRLDLFEPDRGVETVDGREASPVGRPDFKSGWGREPVSGGFDSHSLPPTPSPEHPDVRRS